VKVGVIVGLWVREELIRLWNVRLRLGLTLWLARLLPTDVCRGGDMRVPLSESNYGRPI